MESVKIPLYIHVSELIQEITRTLNEGDKLPSEHSLIAKFGCSRSTVRMAIDVLVSKGLIIRKHGIGSIVSKPRWHYFHQEYISFTEQVEVRGLQAKTVVKSISTTNEKAVIAKFKSDKNYPLIKRLIIIERYRFVSSQLAIVEYTYLPLSYKSVVDVSSIESQGLYRTLSQQGLLEDFRAKEKLTPIILPKDIMDDFNKSFRTPMMLIERTSHNSLGMFEYTKSIIDPEFFSFYRSIRNG